MYEEKIKTDQPLRCKTLFQLGISPLILSFAPRISLDISTIIYRPVRQVFDFVSTPENDFQWQYGTLATARLSEGASKIGTFFRSIGHLMGRRLQGTSVVTNYEPNKEYGFKFLSDPLHLQTSYRFEVVNGGTQINISTRANVVNFFKMDEGVMEKAMKEQLKENLALLKELLEVQRIRQRRETD